MIEINTTDRHLQPDFPLIKKTTKSTDDQDVCSPPKMDGGKKKFFRLDSLTLSDGSMLNSKGTAYEIANRGVLDNLMPATTMNHVANRLKLPLKTLGQLNPETIPEIRDLYSRLARVEGPFLDTTTQMTYHGQVKGTAAHGWGQVITRKGDLIEGFFVDGMLDHFYRMLNRRGVFYEGGIKDSLKHGRGIFRDTNGITVNTTWIAGQASGKTIMSTEVEIKALSSIPLGGGNPFRRTEKGDFIIFEGELHNGLKNGNCYQLDIGKKFAIEGYFVDDLLQGTGKKYYFSGAFYEGYFSANLESGKGTLHYMDGRIYEGEFKSGLPHGKGTLTTNSGTTRPCEFSYGVRSNTLTS